MRHAARGRGVAASAPAHAAQAQRSGAAAQHARQRPRGDRCRVCRAAFAAQSPLTASIHALNGSNRIWIDGLAGYWLREEAIQERTRGGVWQFLVNSTRRSRRAMQRASWLKGLLWLKKTTSLLLCSAGWLRAVLNSADDKLLAPTPTPTVHPEAESGARQRRRRRARNDARTRHTQLLISRSCSRSLQERSKDAPNATQGIDSGTTGRRAVDRRRRLDASLHLLQSRSPGRGGSGAPRLRGSGYAQATWSLGPRRERPARRREDAVDAPRGRALAQGGHLACGGPQGGVGRELRMLSGEAPQLNCPPVGWLLCI